MGNKVSVEEVLKAGGKVKLPGKAAQLLADQLACMLVGVLAGAPDNETRKRALEKARWMLGQW